MNFLAIANPRGGVGKSTTTMMLAEGLALFHDQRVLVLDFDPQAMITLSLIGVDRFSSLTESRRTMFEFLNRQASGERCSLLEFVFTGVSDLKDLRDATGDGRVDLFPMHPAHLSDMAKLDEALSRHSDKPPAETARDLLLDALQAFDDVYDTVLIDCPAGMSTLSMTALGLGTIVIVPTTLENNSLMLVGHFIEQLIAKRVESFPGQRHKIYLLPTLFVRGNAMQQMLLDRLLKSAPVISVAIEQSTALQRAVRHAGGASVRLTREKYGASYNELKELSDWVASELRKLPTENLVAAAPTGKLA